MLLPPPVLAITPALPVAALKEKPLPANEERHEIRAEREGRNLWRLEIWGPKRENVSDYYLKFYRNRHLIETVSAADMGGHTLEFGKIRFATDFPVIAVLGGGLCSPDVTTRFYILQQGRVVLMAAVGAYAGGPIFRDYDGDGKPEWVFDDYTYSKYRDDGPKYLLVYKQLSSGELKLWKTLPNKRRRHLPSLLDEAQQ